jgi:arylsulfatase A-like enzyme
VRFEVRAVEGDGDTHTLFERTLDPRVAEDRGWHDAHVDLEDVIGKRVTLEFAAAAAGGGGPIFLPVWSDPVVQTPAPGAPSFVIVSLDTLRARALGCYGYPRDTSPVIDAIARAGTLFENAITVSATTSPSHMSLFTGRYPPQHGIRGGTERMRPHVATLAELLRAGGYHTAAFTENGFLIRTHGFANGFSEYTENLGETTSGVLGEAEVTFAQTRRWLERNRRFPFFLFVHTYQVHNPYNPPAAHLQLFRDDGLVDPIPQGLRPLRDNYDREIHFADEVARTLFDTLVATGLSDSTIVVLLADHGEEFGEHGALQHGTAVFDEVLRVPLIFWGPGRIPAGQRRTARVSLIDVAPTILDLAGLEIPPLMTGASLVREITHGGALPPRTLFAEAHAPKRWISPFGTEPFNPPLVGVLIGDTKFLVHRPREGEALPTLAYDLTADPYEQRPLEVPAETRANVDRLVDGYLNASDTPGAGPGQDPGEVAETLDPEILEKLRLLGYVQ